MKTTPLLLFLLSLTLASLSSTAEETRKNPAELLPQLAAPDYQSRQEATLLLWKSGDEALPILRKNEHHTHPEIRNRIQALLKDIQVGILPDTPKDVAKMVRNYATATSSGKAVTITKLHNLQLHEQIIRLHLIEKDEHARTLTSPHAKKALETLVTKFLRNNQPDQAIALLKRSKKVEGALFILAPLLHSQSDLAAELATETDPALKLLYARILKDVPLIRKLATELEDEKLLATLAILDGDLTPYLKLQESSLSNQSPDLATGIQLMLQRLQNEPQKTKELTQRISERAFKDGNDNALKALIANGYLNRSLAKMDQYHLREKVAFAELAGNWKTVLAPHQLTPGQPISDKWITHQSTQIIKQLTNENADIDPYFRLISFLQTQNELDEARRLLSPILQHLLAQKYTDAVTESINSIVQFGLLPSILHTLQNDDLRHAPQVTQLLTSLLSQEYDSELVIAKALDDLYPEHSRLQKLTTLAQCLGYLPYPKPAYEQTMQALQDHLDPNSPQEVQVSYLRSLYLSARINAHLNLALSTLDQLIALTAEPDDRPDRSVWLEAKVALLANLGEWEQILPIITENEALRTRTPYHLARHAMLHHKLRNHKKAQALLAKARKRSSLEVKGHAQITHAITDFSALDLAHPYLIQTILSAPLNSTEWITALFHLKAHAKKHQNWKQASAISYFFASQHMQSYLNFNNLYSSWQSTMEGDTYRAAALLTEKPTQQAAQQATALLQRSFDNSPGKVQLADVFFPLTRVAGLTQQHDQWYQEAIAEEIPKADTYPKSHNHKNSLAWLSSRAQRNLPQAERWVKQAIQAEPQNYAYLHTMAEVQHAQGNHQQALDWCSKALHHGANSSAQMRDEHDRFKKAARNSSVSP